MEQRRNARVGKIGDPRNNPPTIGIVRHESHMRNSGLGTGIFRVLNDLFSKNFDNPIIKADLPWRSRLVRHRSGMREALGSNPGSSAEMQGRGKREISEKTRRPTASYGTIPTCENPVTRPGIEACSPWWEASVLIAQPPRPHKIECSGNTRAKLGVSGCSYLRCPWRRRSRSSCADLGNFTRRAPGLPLMITQPPTRRLPRDVTRSALAPCCRHIDCPSLSPPAPDTRSVESGRRRAAHASPEMPEWKRRRPSGGGTNPPTPLLVQSRGGRSEVRTCRENSLHTHRSSQACRAEEGPSREWNRMAWDSTMLPSRESPVGAQWSVAIWQKPPAVVRGAVYRPSGQTATGGSLIASTGNHNENGDVAKCCKQGHCALNVQGRIWVYSIHRHLLADSDMLVYNPPLTAHYTEQETHSREQIYFVSLSPDDESMELRGADVNGLLIHLQDCYVAKTSPMSGNGALRPPRPWWAGDSRVGPHNDGADEGVSKASMEQRRDARTGKTGEPRENPLTSDIDRHDSPARKSGSDLAGNRTQFPYVGGEYTNHTTTIGW
ncbi:hypothetical protein PR048_018885 [Dryococelus australis]|uniref:Uncharacterized protein n=1 Tax=Dryococelus australis TaxID=614101 RepID=A0ABQ9H1X3_9NEOP|nr:hypothetical protein PR048_018885 [Dryococelus australis]